MTESASSQMVLPINALPRVYPEFQRGASHLWSEALEARCVACGICLRSQELKALAEDSNLSPKLERVRMGYCARNTCESRFYSISLPHEASEVTDLSSLENQLPDLPEKKSFVSVTPKQVFTMTALFALFCVVLFSIRLAYYGGRIPLLQERHEYKTGGTAYRQGAL